MQSDLHRFEAGIGSALLHAHQIGQIGNLVFDGFQTHQSVQVLQGSFPAGHGFGPWRTTLRGLRVVGTCFGWWTRNSTQVPGGKHLVTLIKPNFVFKAPQRGLGTIFQDRHRQKIGMIHGIEAGPYVLDLVGIQQQNQIT